MASKSKISMHVMLGEFTCFERRPAWTNTEHNKPTLLDHPSFSKETHHDSHPISSQPP